MNISGLYQCYGQVDELLEQVADWLNKHPTELVMIHFGDIEYPEEAVPKLVEALKLAFPEVGNQVKTVMEWSPKEMGASGPVDSSFAGCLFPPSTIPVRSRREHHLGRIYRCVPLPLSTQPVLQAAISARDRRHPRYPRSSCGLT